MRLVTTRLLGTLALILGLCAAACLTSCALPNRIRAAPSRDAARLGQTVDPQALRADLDKFVDLYSAVIAGAMGTIAAQTQERQAREYAFLVRARQIPRARAALLDEDPREALVRIWGQVIYNRYWYDRGNFGRIFHEFVPMLDEASTTLDEAILELALRHFPPDVVSETRDCLQNTVRSLTPGSDLTPSTEIISVARTSSGNPLSILLFPLRPFEGVSDASESIAQLVQVAQSALRFAKEVPLMARWQAEMLLFEMDSMETMTVMREESSRLSNHIEALGRTADALPQRIREESQILLNSADAAAARVSQTLVETQRASEQINAALVQAERVSESLLTTSTAVTTTMESTRGLIVDLERYRAPRPEDTTGTPPLDLTELSRVAESLTRAASEIRALLAEVGQPLTPKSGVNQTLERASLELNGLLNGLLWRGAVLIGLAFVAALAFHAITRATRQAAA
jgi:hypothetical protein